MVSARMTKARRPPAVSASKNSTDANVRMSENDLYNPLKIDDYDTKPPAP